jgi:hypothetical protein
MITMSHHMSFVGDGIAVIKSRAGSCHHIPYPDLLEPGELTPRQVAHLTGVSTVTTHYWINSGYLAARGVPEVRLASELQRCASVSVGSRP